MARPDKIDSHSKLKAHIEAHCQRLALGIGWETFVRMAEAKVSINSIMRTFDVRTRATVDKWLRVYEMGKKP